MAVTAPVSLSKIRTEFGGASPPANLKAYNRTGTYVPDSTANAAISTDPNLLRISQFDGAVKSVPPAVAMADQPWAYVQGQSGVVQGAVSVDTNGTWSITQNGGGTWLTAGVASDVEMMHTRTGGSGATWSGSSPNVWYPSLNIVGGRTTNGTTHADIFITFRNKNTLAQLDTAAIGLEIYRGIPL